MENEFIKLFTGYGGDFGIADMSRTEIDAGKNKIKPGYEIIKDGINGLLCDPKDPDDIMNSILKIIEDEDLKTSLGINGRKTVENNFSIEKIVIENIKFYESCIKNYV